MIEYLGLGVIWTLWLEYYTTKHFEGSPLGEWHWVERFVHIALWPGMVIFFLYISFKNK